MLVRGFESHPRRLQGQESCKSPFSGRFPEACLLRGSDKPLEEDDERQWRPDPLEPRPSASFASPAKGDSPQPSLPLPLSGPSGSPGEAANAPLHVSLVAAIVVLVAWINVPLAAGSWRTNTRDA
jgi:hypothetical protein